MIRKRLLRAHSYYKFNSTSIAPRLHLRTSQLTDSRSNDVYLLDQLDHTSTVIGMAGTSSRFRGEEVPKRVICVTTEAFGHVVSRLEYPC